MEALATLCSATALLPVTQAQSEANAAVINLSAESWVAICMACALPVIALILIWFFFFYCIRKTELAYKEVCKDLEKRQRYLIRKQQHIKDRQLQQKASGLAPKHFNQRATARPNPQNHSLAPHVHRGQPFAQVPPHLAAVGNRGYDRGGAGERVLQPRMHPHLQYQHFPKELQYQQRQAQVNAQITSGSRGHSGSNLEHGHSYASNFTSPFNFQRSPTGVQYTGVLPAKDYPIPKSPSSQSSNYGRNSAFGQLTTWPQFN